MTEDAMTMYETFGYVTKVVVFGVKKWIASSLARSRNWKECLVNYLTCVSPSNLFTQESIDAEINNRQSAVIPM